MTLVMSDQHVDKIEAVLPGRWDVEALRAGASVCLVFAIPFRVLAFLIDSDSSGLNFVFFALFVSFFVIGSGCAAWVQRAGTPVSHGLVTALGTYAAAEVVFVAIRFVRGTPIPWLSLMFALSFVSLAGLIGGFLGSRLRGQGMRPSSQR
jgi:hypothetical protein